MTSPEEEIRWITAMIELEEERGPIVPGGAVGGVVARARRERVTGVALVALPPALERARGRVRRAFQAVEKAA